MPDQINLFPEFFPFFTGSLKEKTTAGSGKERSSLDELFSRTKAYHNSKDFYDLLKFITNFTRYSPLNCYLIHTQNPFASYVATANQWLKRFGRRVKAEAKPIVILSHMSSVLFVYDVADTEGEPLPKILADSSGIKASISRTIWGNTVNNCARDLIRVYESREAASAIESVKTLKKAEPVQVSEDEIYAARYAIRMDKNHSITQNYASLVHELAHLYSGHLGSDKTAWWTNRQNDVSSQVQKEIEAESISYLVCNRQRIETPAAEFLSNYAGKSIDMPEFSMDVVLRVAGHIETMGRRVVRKRKK